MPFRLYRGRREPAIQGEYFVRGARMPHEVLPVWRGGLSVRGDNSEEFMAFWMPAAMVVLRSQTP
jgi:hypothetical protein